MDETGSKRHPTDDFHSADSGATERSDRVSAKGADKVRGFNGERDTTGEKLSEAERAKIQARVDNVIQTAHDRSPEEILEALSDQARLLDDDPTYYPRKDQLELKEQAMHGLPPIKDERYLVSLKRVKSGEPSFLGRWDDEGRYNRVWVSRLSDVHRADLDARLLADIQGMENCQDGDEYEIQIIDRYNLTEHDYLLSPTYDTVANFAIQQEFGKKPLQLSDTGHEEIVSDVCIKDYNDKYAELMKSFPKEGSEFNAEDFQDFVTSLGLNADAENRIYVRQELRKRLGVDSRWTGEGCTRHASQSWKKTNSGEVVPLEVDEKRAADNVVYGTTEYLIYSPRPDWTGAEEGERVEFKKGEATVTLPREFAATQERRGGKYAPYKVVVGRREVKV